MSNDLRPRGRRIDRVRNRLARLIDAFGETLVWIAARCFEAAYTLNPELLDASHAEPSTPQVIATKERASVCDEAVHMADDTNRPVYVVPRAATRQWMN